MVLATVTRSSTDTLDGNDDPLTQVLNSLVPADENPESRARRLALEQEALRVSEQIGERLRQESLEKKRGNFIKVLLLGQDDAAGLTLLKNIQWCYAPSSFRTEAYAWRAVIHLSLLKAMLLIVDTLHQTSNERLLTSQELRVRLVRLAPLRMAEEYLKIEMSLPGEERDTGVLQTGSKEFIVRSVSTWKEAFSNWREAANSEGSLQQDVKVESILDACAEDMIALWTNQDVKEVLKERQVHIEEPTGYFLNGIDRIARKTYQPTYEDVLWARIPTVGLQEYRINFDTGRDHSPEEWRIHSAGVSRSQSTAWEGFFDKMDAVVFLAPLGVFDQALPTDRHVNCIEDSLLSWRRICSSKTLAKVELILVLTDLDRLAHKIDVGIKLASYIPRYKDLPNTSESVTKYLRNQFRAIHAQSSLNQRTFRCHTMSRTDIHPASTIVASVREAVIRANLQAAHF